MHTRLLIAGPILFGIGGVYFLDPIRILLGAAYFFRPLALVLVFAGIGMAIYGLVGLFFPDGVDIVEDRIKRLRRGAKRFTKLSHNHTNLQELKAYDALAQNFFKNERATFAQMKEWHLKNSSIFTIVYKTTGANATLQTKRAVGLVTIVPVTPEAAQLLEANQLSGTQLATEHILNMKGKPKALYIAAIAARPESAGVYAEKVMVELIMKYVKKGVSVLYTRPVSEKGKHLTDLYEFRPVEEPRDGNPVPVYRKEIE